MTLRRIQWIADSGLLVGLTMIGEFAAAPVLGSLSLSSSEFSLGVPAAGAIVGATAGSVIAAMGLPAGLAISSSQDWTYDGSGAAGAYVFSLSETLAGAVNSPLVTAIAMTVSALAPGSSLAPGATLDFSQPANSDLIAATRSF